MVKRSTQLCAQEKRRVRSQCQSFRLCRLLWTYSRPRSRQVTLQTASSPPGSPCEVSPSFRITPASPLGGFRPQCIEGLLDAWCYASLLTDLVSRLWVWECLTKVHALSANPHVKLIFCRMWFCRMCTL